MTACARNGIYAGLPCWANRYQSTDSPYFVTRKNCRRAQTLVKHFSQEANTSSSLHGLYCMLRFISGGVRARNSGNRIGSVCKLMHILRIAPISAHHLQLIYQAAFSEMHVQRQHSPTVRTRTSKHYEDLNWLLSRS